MMGTSMLTIRLDDNIKQNFESAVNSLGMNMTTAITLFAKATIKYQAIPFAITADPFDDPVTRARIEAELDRRSERARDPNTKQYSGQEIKERLGLI